ncbi:MAG: terminase, partial [Aliifodinibius sp.]|nr:terminase [Fodinibius sp.]NIV14128.1 terminase [Fodinibius sp.]NIY27949.1 terminase [Fodinibius sp.]
MKWSWFHTYDKAPVKGDYDQIIQSWDTACKTESMHDYSVCTTWMIKSQKMYLLHVLRQRLDYPSLKKRIITYAKMKHANQILIEDMGAGTS